MAQDARNGKSQEMEHGTSMDKDNGEGQEMEQGALMDKEDIETIVQLNIQFYRKVMALTSSAKEIESEVIFFDDYMGGPDDDNVQEKITYADIDVPLYNLVVCIEEGRGKLADYTRRLCLGEILAYCRKVEEKTVLSEDKLRAYSRQESPGIHTADYFISYQQRIKELDALAKALNAALVKESPELYEQYNSLRTTYEQAHGITRLTKPRIREIIEMLENLDT